MMMKHWIAQLEATAEVDRAKEKARREERERTEVSAARVRLTPLEDRLVRLLSTVPVELKREGLSLSSLQASLRGRSRGNCHPGELGAALRRLGFKRRRQWRDGASYGALWFPT
jgi:hypothetical protein